MGCDGTVLRRNVEAKKLAPQFHPMEKRCQKSSGHRVIARFFVTAFLRCVTDRRMPCQGNFRVSTNQNGLPVTGQMDCSYYNPISPEWKILAASNFS